MLIYMKKKKKKKTLQMESKLKTLKHAQIYVIYG